MIRAIPNKQPFCNWGKLSPIPTFHLYFVSHVSFMQWFIYTSATFVSQTIKVEGNIIGVFLFDAKYLLK